MPDKSLDRSSELTGTASHGQLLRMVTDVIASYVKKNHVATNDLPDIITAVETMLPVVTVMLRPLTLRVIPSTTGTPPSLLFQEMARLAFVMPRLIRERRRFSCPGSSHR